MSIKKPEILIHTPKFVRHFLIRTIQRMLLFRKPQDIVLCNELNKYIEWDNE